MTKGQASMVTHAILVGFVVFLILVIVNTVLTLRDNFQSFTLNNEIDQTCLILEGGLEKVFHTTAYGSPSGSRSVVDINLPDRLADEPYKAVFRNRTIEIDVTSVNTTCNIGFDADYSGSSAGGSTEISFTINSTSRLIEMKSI